AHAVEFHHFRGFLDDLREAAQPFVAVDVGADRYKDGHSRIDLGGIKQRHPPLDHPLFLKFLDAPPARGRRKPHPLCDIGHGERGVLLQKAQYLAVETIHRKLQEIFSKRSAYDGSIQEKFSHASRKGSVLCEASAVPGEWSRLSAGIARPQ